MFASSLSRLSVLRLSPRLTGSFAQVAKKAGSESSLHEVSILDPRSLVENGEATSDPQPQVRLSVSPQLYKEFTVGGGIHDLGDADDPMNSWTFGKGGEIFQLHFVGRFPCPSGYACVADGSSPRLPPQPKGSTWAKLRKDIEQQAALPAPLLWGGYILEAAEAAVYVKRKGGEIEGVTIVSADEGA